MTLLEQLSAYSPCCEQEAAEETGLKNIRPVTEAIWSLEILGVAAHIRRSKFVSAHLHLNVTYLRRYTAAFFSCEQAQ